MGEALTRVSPVRGVSPTLPDLFRWRVGAAAGITLLALGLMPYTSEHPAILHRWSVDYFLVILATAFIAAVLWSHSWRLAHSAGSLPSTAAKCTDAAVLSWGLASLIAAMDQPSRASDLLGGNVVGFETPVATLLGWVPLALAFAAVLSMPRVQAELTRRPWLLSVLAVAAMLLAGEGVMRLWAVIQPQVQAFPTHRTSMWLHRYAPLDEAGFRQPERTLSEAGSGARRLLVIGDSYAFGWGITHPSDRISNRLVAHLDTATGARWDLYDISRPDLDTRQEIDLATSVPTIHPDLAVILYVFNDMEYLAPTTERSVMTEAPQGLAGRIHPGRLLFLNSFLLQEAYVRTRYLRLQSHLADPAGDPYADAGLVRRHLRDLCRLVRVAADSGAVVGVVPLDIATTIDSGYQVRMDRFSKAARAAGIPVWRVDSAFTGHKFSELRVNTLDGHPNELADQLAERALAQQIVPILWGAKRRPRVTCQSES